MAQRPAIIIGARAPIAQRAGARVRDRTVRTRMRADIFTRIYLSHSRIASRAPRPANATDPDPIRSPRYPIASHRIASRVRTANKLNASRRDDASALATTVAARAVRVACARRGLSAAARAVKEDKVTDDDDIFGRACEYGAIDRAIVEP